MNEKDSTTIVNVCEAVTNNRWKRVSRIYGEGHFFAGEKLRVIYVFWCEIKKKAFVTFSLLTTYDVCCSALLFSLFTAFTGLPSSASFMAFKLLY